MPDMRLHHVEKVKDKKGAFGFNAQTDKYEDMIAAGVIDPMKVTRFALQNAASVSALMLTTQCMISEKPKKSPRCRLCLQEAVTAEWICKTFLQYKKDPLLPGRGFFYA